MKVITVFSCCLSFIRYLRPGEKSSPKPGRMRFIAWSPELMTTYATLFPAQLLARIRAVSRRGRSTLTQRPSSLITIGPVTVDSLHNKVLSMVRNVEIFSQYRHIDTVSISTPLSSQHINLIHYKQGIHDRCRQSELSPLGLLQSA